jgi:hypothetical protein
MRDGDRGDKEFFSPLDEGERRNRLRRLDDLLSALEDMNLREEGEITQSLRDRLLLEGIPVKPTATVTDLIDIVLNSQDQYMLKERRTGKRRRRLSFVPTDDELVSVISSRIQRR